MMRQSWGPIIVAAAIVAPITSAPAHEADHSRLKAGRAASVHAAEQEQEKDPTIWLVGGGVVVGGVALAVSGGHHQGPVSTTTSTPSTTTTASTTGTSGH